MAFKSLVDTQMTYNPESSSQSSYEFNDGLRVIPVMGPAGTAPVVARVHAPYTMRQTQFNYIKSGTPPLAPPPATTTSGYVFLSGNMEIPAPSSGNSDGALVYGVRGTYNFVAPGHVPTTKKIYYDAFPWISGVDMLGITPSSVHTPNFGADPELGGYYNIYYGESYDLDLFGSTRLLG